VDHPLCEECTDTLLESMEQQLELAEQDSQVGGPSTVAIENICCQIGSTGTGTGKSRNLIKYLTFLVKFL
jgi:hypothetical protein